MKLAFPGWEAGVTVPSVQTGGAVLQEKAVCSSSVPSDPSPQNPWGGACVPFAVAEAVRLTIAAKENANRRATYTKELRRVLRRFG